MRRRRRPRAAAATRRARDRRGETWPGPRRVVCRRRGGAGWTRASAIRPGPRARGRRSLRRRRSPRRGSPSHALRRPPPPTRPRPSLRRARTARATTTRGSRARPATRSRRWWHRERRDARRFATDPRTTFRACTLRPAFPRSLARRPRRNPESRRRQRRAPCASRDTSTVRPTSARARAPAPTRPLRHPFQRVAFLGRAEEATPLSASPAVPRNISHRRSNISRARSLALRFFLIPASRASLPGQVFASPKPSARCW